MPSLFPIGLRVGVLLALVGEGHATAVPVPADYSKSSVNKPVMPTQARDTEARLRQVIGQLQQGQPDYDQMEPALRAAVRQQMDVTTSMLRALGAVQAIAYEGQQQNADVYDIRFANGAAVCLISLSPEGKTATLFVNRPVFAQTATEDRLRQVIEQLQQGQPDYDQMEPALQAAVRQQTGAVAAKLHALGAVQAITYKGQQQGDAYEVRFANG